MNLRKAASRSAGIFISCEAVVDAGVRQQHARAAGAGDDDDVLALGRRQHLHAAGEVEHVAKRPRADDAGLLAARPRRSCRCRRARRYASSPPGRPAAVRPAFSIDDRLLLGDALRHLGEGAAVLQILAVHGDDMGVVVLLEEGQEIVLVEIGFVAQSDDRRDAHLGRAREADDRHADAAGLRRERRVALVVVGACRRWRRDSSSV